MHTDTAVVMTNSSASRWLLPTPSSWSVCTNINPHIPLSFFVEWLGTALNLIIFLMLVLAVYWTCVTYFQVAIS